ncbi:hypothetical protein HDE_11937 [Halotydeus destructor]|nr:hypothetical protein HDE_11937 [Halotydeus destructor]
MQDPYVRYPRNANFSKENVNQVRKRRAKKDTNQPGSQYPSTYSDFNFMPSDQFDNFDAQEQFLNPREQGLQVGPALKAKAEVQRKVGLRLPVKHKAIARSCVSKKKKSNWVNYENEDMVQTRTRKPLSLKGPPSEQVPLSQDFYSYDFDQFAEPEEPYVDYSGLQQYQYPVQGIPMDGMSMKAPPSGGILPGMSGQQKMKLGFALLMVPSLIVMMTSHKKFNSSSSNSNIDMSALKAAGFSGLPGLGAAGGGGQLPTEGYGSENIANLLKGRRKPTATAKYDVPDYDDLLGFAAHGRESSPESSSSPYGSDSRS